MIKTPIITHRIMMMNWVARKTYNWLSAEKSGPVAPPAEVLIRAVCMGTCTVYAMGYYECLFSGGYGWAPLHEQDIFERLRRHGKPVPYIFTHLNAKGGVVHWGDDVLVADKFLFEGKGARIWRRYVMEAGQHSCCLAGRVSGFHPPGRTDTEWSCRAIACCLPAVRFED